MKFAFILLYTVSFLIFVFFINKIFVMIDYSLRKDRLSTGIYLSLYKEDC